MPRKPGSGFIASPAYDATFFILAPLLALGLVEVLDRWPWANARHSLLGIEDQPIPFFIAVWSYSHAFAVFFRTHLNAGVFAQHRFRFVAVPLLLFLGLGISDGVMIAGLVLAPFWAVYHIGMQNFGLARIYDLRCGNPPTAGRRLDWWLHQFVNLGPFLLGLSLLPTMNGLVLFSRLGWEAPVALLPVARSSQPQLAAFLLPATAVFLTVYAIGQVRLLRRGHRVSPQKYSLTMVTAAVSVLGWGFLPAWKAAFVMNFFHGLQYLALVWWLEKGSLQRAAGVADRASGPWLALALFSGTTLLIGIAYRVYGSDYLSLRWAAAAGLSISLLHYWYDGFVWSVRRREV